MTNAPAVRTARNIARPLEGAGFPLIEQLTQDMKPVPITDAAQQENRP